MLADWAVHRRTRGTSAACSSPTGGNPSLRRWRAAGRRPQRWPCCRGGRDVGRVDERRRERPAERVDDLVVNVPGSGEWDRVAGMQGPWEYLSVFVMLSHSNHSPISLVLGRSAQDIATAPAGEQDRILFLRITEQVVSDFTGVKRRFSLIIRSHRVVARD
jgi:hypothetical protein